MINKKDIITYKLFLRTMNNDKIKDFLSNQYKNNIISNEQLHKIINYSIMITLLLFIFLIFWFILTIFIPFVFTIIALFLSIFLIIFIIVLLLNIIKKITSKNRKIDDPLNDDL